jgi:Ca2+-binding EF-hand superfamily protein
MAEKIQYNNTATELAKSFQLLDEDKSGYIDADELKTILRITGTELQDVDLEMIIEAVDTNKDGKIS